MRPQGYLLRDRQVSHCPTKIPLRYIAALRQWSRWERFGGLPGPGGLGEQDSWLMTAIEVLHGESELIKMAQMEERQASNG